MAATKAQEREALEQIKAIVEGLGEDSYVGKALEGTLEIAKSNIDDDAMISLAERLECKELIIQNMRKEKKALETENDELRRKLEETEGWHKYGEDGTDSNVTQKEYESLKKTGRTLSDSEAAALVADEFGFSREKIEILHEIETWEINNRRQMRQAGTVERDPVYDASDWNYVRFNVRCGGITWSYEMDDGDLKQYNC